MPEAWLFFITVLTLALSGFFSGSEIAFISANRLKIELRSKQGDRTGTILSKFVKNTPRVLTTILIGNNLALVLYSYTLGQILEPVVVNALGLNLSTPGNLSSEATVILIQTLISTLIILVFGEYVPKALFRINADKMINSSAWVLNFFYILFYYIVSSINGMARFFITRVLKLKYEEEELEFSKQDLDQFIREALSAPGSGSANDINTEMFANALEFNETRARDFMVPRTEIEALPIDASLDELLTKFIETEHSRIIIYRNSLDEVVGYVHTSSLFKDYSRIMDILQPVLMVPESMPAHVLLSEFTKSRKGVAIVVDEFGGTEGMITIEDLVEEVFGEIVDEFDEEEVEELIQEKIDENTWLFSARLEVDDINKEYDLELPEGDYNTIGGLVMHFAESIPQANEELVVDDFKILILDASDNKINTVKIERLNVD